MIKKHKISHEFEVDNDSERIKEPLNLKINLDDVPITDTLKNTRIQNFSEIINAPPPIIIKKPKKKFSLSNLNEAIFKKKPNIDASFISTKPEPFSSRINFENFFESEILPSSGSNTRGSTPKKNRTIKTLVNEDYTNYVKSLKVMYPKFKLNHYKRNKTQIDKNEYEVGKSEDFLSSLALADNYKEDKETFKIQKRILERSDLDEIQMISHDFDYKIEVVEMELNKTLSYNSKLLYNYIENNSNVERDIVKYVNGLNNKKNLRNTLIKNYLLNLSKMIIRGKKRENALKILNILYLVKKIKENIQKTILFKNQNEQEMNFQELSLMIDNIKGQIKIIRAIEGCKKLKMLYDCDNILLSFNDKNEEKLLNQLSIILNNLFNICIDFSEQKPTDNIHSSENNKSTSSSSSKYNIQPDFSEINNNNEENKLNYLFAKENFKFSNEKNNFEFYLSYIKETQENVPKISNLLITFIEIIDICIKDNVDILSIVSGLEKIVKNQIMRIFDQIQKKENLNQTELLFLLSNAFIIFISNYNFILFLLQTNFGLNLRMFSSLTNYVNEEIKKFIILLTSSNVHVYSINCEIDNFLNGIDSIKKSIDSFLTFYNLNFYEFNKKLFEEFFSSCYDKDTKLIQTQLENEKWVQKNDIQIEYQQILDQILSQKTEVISDNKTVEYLIINNSKFKATQFTITLIDYINQQISIYKKIDSKKLTEGFVNQIYSFLLSILAKSRDCIINKNNESNSTQVITELEITVFSSHCIIFKNLLSFFLEKIPNENLTNTFKEINTTCKDGMNELINYVVESIITEFTALDFSNYPVFPEKDYNTHIKKFTRIKKLYDLMVVSFLKEDVIEIFLNTFKNCFEKMNEIVKSKCHIEDDNMIKQFRSEMLYIKKVLKKFDVVPYEDLYKIIGDISININPNKLPTKKKKNNDA